MLPWREALAPQCWLRRRHQHALTLSMINPGKAEKWAARSARLSAALRENLKRRKEQARGRKAEDVAAADADIGTAPDFRRNPGGKVGDGSVGPGTGRGG